MAKWEYLFVEANYECGWKPRLVAGESITDWQDGMSLYQFCDFIGQQGWEMLSANSTYANSDNNGNLTRELTLVFKREILNEATT